MWKGFPFISSVWPALVLPPSQTDALWRFPQVLRDFIFSLAPICSPHREVEHLVIQPGGVPCSLQGRGLCGGQCWTRSCWSSLLLQGECEWNALGLLLPLFVPSPLTTLLVQVAFSSCSLFRMHSVWLICVWVWVWFWIGVWAQEDRTLSDLVCMHIERVISHTLLLNPSFKQQLQSAEMVFIYHIRRACIWNVNTTGLLQCSNLSHNTECVFHWLGCKLYHILLFWFTSFEGIITL